jgi:large subunit ribosomal protein L17
MSRHMMRGRQLSVDTEHRKALRRNLVQSLFEHGKVRTTLPRAKEVQAMAERLITLARTGTLNARRHVISILGDRRLVDEEQEFTGKKVVQKLFDEVAPQFSDRPGGYSRITKLSDYRIGDGGSLVLLQLLTEKTPPRGTARRSAGLRRKRTERRQQFASKAMKKFKDRPQTTAEAAPPAEAAPAAESATPADTSSPQA